MRCPHTNRASLVTYVLSKGYSKSRVRKMRMKQLYKIWYLNNQVW